MSPVVAPQLLTAWTQNYYPLGNLFLSALVAALPVIVLLGSLGLFHIKAHIAALLGLGTALLVALLAFGMPAELAFSAAANGALYGLFPIGWIVVGAIFVYDITVFTGKFEVIKHTIAALASDRRIQLLLIGFSFGAFIEGSAGFGTPVAISAAMLIGLGFKPLQAAGLSLIGNTAPVAFGALGSPLIALASVTGIKVEILSSMVGKQLTLFCILVPFWLIWAMAGRKGMWEVWPACLTAGVSFGATQLLVSNLHGPWVVDIIASIVSISSVIILLKFWQPPTIWRFDHDEDIDPVKPVPSGSAALEPALMRSESGKGHSTPAPRSVGAAVARPIVDRKAAFIAWMPWVILSVLVFTWGIPEVKTFFNNISAPQFQIPFLDKSVFRAPPVVPKPTAESAVFVFNWISAAGTALLLTGIISGSLLGLKPATLLRLFGKTLWRVRFSLLTIAAMMALGYTTRFAGSDATMGLAFASTGALFAFFSPLLGWLGVALTGSDTSSNVLFGNLQQITAQQIGINPVLAAASNSAGGVMGKMIDAQSIVVAGVATGQQGGEGKILRYVFFHSLVLASLVGIMVVIQAYVLPS